MCPVTTDTEFFDRKRPWSRIKDQIIGSYMPAYLAKVSKLGHRIILIDAFAGPGLYKGETGPSRIGSPLIMCTEAEKYAKGRYHAIFCNRDKAQHEQLTEALEEMGGLVTAGIATPLLGDSRHLLDSVLQLLTNQTVLLYLDPFGLKGCEFETIKPFLERPKQYSTEIVVNISVPIIYRLASVHAVEAKNIKPRILRYHARLTSVLGGDWWKEIMWAESLLPEQKAWQVMERYTKQLRSYLPYAGFCPVRERGETRLKYFITFCSRHIDSLLLLNDIMCKAYNEYIVTTEWAGTLFAESIAWTDNRPLDMLDRMILDTVRSLNDGPIPPRRLKVWEEIVTIPGNFMRFTSSEFKSRVQTLLKEGRLTYKDTRGTGRLNDDSLLYIAAD